MSINRDLVKKKLDALKATSNRNTLLWKPQSGTTRVRIVPYQHQKDNPFLELYFYYDLGGKTYLSNQTFNEPDPIVEFCEELRSTGQKEDWLLSKKLEPKLRTYVPIIVRGEEKEGVKFWGFGKGIYQELLSVITDPDYGDITDLNNGRDVEVTYQTPKEAGNTYGKVSIRVKPNQTPATEEKDLLKQILENQTKILDVFKKRTYEELKDALEKWLDPESYEEKEKVKNEKIEKARKVSGIENVQNNTNEKSDEEKSDLPFDNEDDDNSSKDSEEDTSVEDDFDKLFND